MKRTICTLAIAATLAAASVSTAAALQDATRPDTAPTRRAAQIIKVLSLKYADAEDIAQVVRTVGVVRLSLDERTNSIIVAGTADELTRVEELVATLDRPATNTTRADRETRYFNLTLPVDVSMQNLVRSVVSGGTRIAADGKMLVVQGRQQDLDEVAALVRKLNETASTRMSPFESANPRSIQTHFYFISMSLEKGASDKDATPLPSALKPVADALAESGFYNPSLLAPLFVNTKEAGRGDQFQVSGQAGDINIRVSGAVGQSGSPDSVDLSVSAKLTAPQFTENPSRAGGTTKHRSGTQSLFDIQTRLNVKLNDYVVLAAAPSSDGDGRAIALVVRATSGN